MMNTAPPADETILVRIKKLLALAESNENEAAAAAAKAQDLLTKHNLALVDLEDVDPARREHVEEFDWADLVYPGNKVQGWREDLFVAVVQSTYCRGWFTYNFKQDANGFVHFYDAIGRRRWRRERKAVVIGRPSDVEVAKYLYAYLTRTLYKLADQYAWEHADREQRGQINRLRASFLKGAVSIVRRRLYTEWKQAQTAAEVTALVVVRDGELQDWMSAHGIKLTTGRNSRRDADGSAYMAGADAGRSIALSRGIGGAAGERQLR